MHILYWQQLHWTSLLAVLHMYRCREVWAGVKMCVQFLPILLCSALLVLCSKESEEGEDYGNTATENLMLKTNMHTVQPKMDLIITPPGVNIIEGGFHSIGFLPMIWMWKVIQFYLNWPFSNWGKTMMFLKHQ